MGISRCIPLESSSSRSPVVITIISIIIVVVVDVVDEGKRKDYVSKTVAATF